MTGDRKNWCVGMGHFLRGAQNRRDGEVMAKGGGEIQFLRAGAGGKSAEWQQSLKGDIQ